MDPVEGDKDYDSINDQDIPREMRVSGRQFANSVSLPVDPDPYDDPTKLEFDLGRDYATFTATIGLSDSSDSDAVVRFRILGDKARLVDRELTLGQAKHVELPVTNVLRLALVVWCVSGRFDTATYAVFGNAGVS